MEAVPPVRTSLLGIPLLVMKLSVLVSGDGGQRGGGHKLSPSQLPYSCWTWKPDFTSRIS